MADIIIMGISCLQPGSVTRATLGALYWLFEILCGMALSDKLEMDRVLGSDMDGGFPTIQLAVRSPQQQETSLPLFRNC